MQTPKFEYKYEFMLPDIKKVKGIHPGAILKREIKALGYKSNELSDSIKEYAQTISAILNERRGINPALSIKLGQKLGVEEDYFMLLQASYDVKKALLKTVTTTPNLNIIRKSLFWDTSFDNIDWNRNRKAIIKRIFERGNEQEIKEIIAFYGRPVIKAALKNISNDFLPSFQQNILKYKLTESKS